MSKRVFMSLMVVLPALLAGCTTKSAVFEGRTPEQVWTAMVAIAEEPRYDNWVVVENNVWVDGVFDRIEIQRSLKRDHHRHGSKPVRETEHLELQAVLERTEPPVVTVTVRNAMIRGKGLMAIDHFLAELGGLLDPDETTMAAE